MPEQGSPKTEMSNWAEVMNSDEELEHKGDTDDDKADTDENVLDTSIESIVDQKTDNKTSPKEATKASPEVATPSPKEAQPSPEEAQISPEEALTTKKARAKKVQLANEEARRSARTATMPRVQYRNQHLGKDSEQSKLNQATAKAPKPAAATPTPKQDPKTAAKPAHKTTPKPIPTPKLTATPKTVTTPKPTTTPPQKPEPATADKQGEGEKLPTQQGVEHPSQQGIQLPPFPLGPAIIQKQKAELDDLRAQLQAQVKLREAAQEQLKTSEMSLDEAVKDIDRLKAQNQKLEERNEHTTNQVRQAEARLSEAEAVNDELVKQITSNQSKPEAPQKTKVTLIGDSNVHRTIKLLDRQKAQWTVVNHIYTTVELKQALETKEFKDQLKDQDKILIQQGTNDVRGKSGLTESEAYDTLVQSASIIAEETGAQVFIAEIPPMRIPDRADLGAKAVLFNSRVRSTTIDNVNIIKTTPYYKQVDYEKTMDAGGFHLAEKGLEALRDALEDAVSGKPAENNDPTPTKDNVVTLHVNTKPDYIGVVLGRKGNMKNQIESQTGARIRVINNTDESTIQIKGTEESAQKAKSAIENILKTKAKSATSTTQDDKAKSATAPPPKSDMDKATVMCPFFKKGVCRFGPKCHKSHTREAKRHRSPSPDRSNKNAKRSPTTTPRQRGPRPGHHSRQQKPSFSILE